MLKADKLKLKILELLRDGEMTLGQLRQRTRVAHHYTLVRALEFLEKIGLVEVKAKGDKLGSKMVRLKK